LWKWVHFVEKALDEREKFAAIEGTLNNTNVEYTTKGNCR
jgi:hypothetical protein